MVSNGYLKYFHVFWLQSSMVICSSPLDKSFFLVSYMWQALQTVLITAFDVV
jgi:hypothetical protein